MRVVRLLMAGLIAVGVMLAGLFAAAVVVFAGMLGWLAQQFRRKPAPAKPDQDVPVAPRAIFRRTETADAIDIEATTVSEKPPAGGGRPVVR